MVSAPLAPASAAAGHLGNRAGYASAPLPPGAAAAGAVTAGASTSGACCTSAALRYTTTVRDGARTCMYCPRLQYIAPGSAAVPAGCRASGRRAPLGRRQEQRNSAGAASFPASMTALQSHEVQHEAEWGCRAGSLGGPYATAAATAAEAPPPTHAPGCNRQQLPGHLLNPRPRV